MSLQKLQLFGFFCLTQPTEEQILDYYYYDKAVTLNIIMAHLFLVGRPEIVPNKLHNGGNFIEWNDELGLSVLGKAGSPVETMRDDLPTLKLDKLFILVSIMTDWPVNTRNT